MPVPEGECRLSTATADIDVDILPDDLDAYFCTKFGYNDCATSATEVATNIGNVQVCTFLFTKKGRLDLLKNTKRSHHIALYVLAIFGVIGVVAIGGYLYVRRK